MKLLLLMTLLLVRDVLWHVVRISVFQETNHFTLSFSWIIRENTKESLLVLKGFLNAVSVFHLAHFHSSKPSYVLSHLNTVTNNDNKYLNRSGTCIKV